MIFCLMQNQETYVDFDFISKFLQRNRISSAFFKSTNFNIIVKASFWIFHKLPAIYLNHILQLLIPF